MALSAPQNLQADYYAFASDRFGVQLFWEPVPGAAYYNVYRDNDKFEVRPDQTTGNFEIIDHNGLRMITHRDGEAWYAGQSLDLFFWVAAVAYDPATNAYTEGEISDAITNLHPFALRTIELTRSMIGDDLQIFNDKSGVVKEQMSIYNYKCAVDISLSAINQTPTATTFQYGSYPHQWQNLLVQGTLYYALPKLILLEQAKQMKFADQGQEWTPPDLVVALKELRKEIGEDFNAMRKEVKHNVLPHGMGVGSMHALFISPQLMKWRHVPSGRNFF